MSRKEIVSMVSRAFMWAFTELTYLPDRLLGLIHHVNERSTLTQHDYWTSYYLILTVFTVLRILVFLVVALSFWRCGPRVEAVFSLQQDRSDSGETKLA